MGMSTDSSLRAILRKLQRLVSPGANQGLTDAALLQRFARERDESAFDEILHRHGRMVMGVCLRMLGDWHAAEDAYQATFLVLARRAGSIGWQASVSNWLYGVACRIARKERARLARRREQPAEAMPEPVQPAERANELAGLLDEELSQLPEKYRAPIVLCYLEGRSNEEAARRLGWPVGTVWCHLSRGRQMLRSRLERRGVALGAALLAALVGRDATAAATSALAERTTQAAVAFAVGSPVKAGLVSGHALELARAGCAAVGFQRWWIVAVTVLALAFVTGQLGVQTSQPTAPAAALPGAAAPKAAPPRPKPADPAGDPVVSVGLKWLASEQKADGRWTMGARFDDKDIAATGAALLPFLGADGAREGSAAHKAYGDVVQKGLAFLVKSQKENGSFDGLMYAHGIATLAMCEASIQSGDAEHKKSAERGIALIIKAQTKAGSWGYAAVTERGDSSISGWQCLALAAGQRAGFEVPEQTWKRYADWLDSVAAANGAYGYVNKSQGSAVVAAGCGLGRLHLGWDPARAELVRTVEFLESQPGFVYMSDGYTGYFVSAFMTRQGADTWTWSRGYRAELVRTQQRDGSWAPPDAGNGMGYPKLLHTALKLASLQHRGEFVPLPKPPNALEDRQVRALWDDLSSSELSRAALAMRTLIAVPGQSVPLAEQKLERVRPADAARVAKLLVDLDSDEFAVRQRAEKELAGYAEGARGALEAARKKPGGSLEYRRRLERLVEAMDDRATNFERVREMRGLRVLETIGTPEARKVLRELASGAPAATLTREAQAALERMEKKK